MLPLSTGQDRLNVNLGVLVRRMEDSTWKCYTIGALVIRIGFWGILYSNYNKEPPESIGTSSQSR